MLFCRMCMPKHFPITVKYSVLPRRKIFKTRCTRKGNKPTEIEGLFAKEILCMKILSQDAVLPKGGKELMGISNI